MSEPLKEVSLVRVRDGRLAEDVDRAAVEEPLEVRLHRRPFAVIMRTPGADRELTAGFLLGERVLKHADELGTIEYCSDADGQDGSAVSVPPATGSEGLRNVVNVTLSGGSEASLDRVLAERRQVIGNTSCGVCGRQTIDALAKDLAPLPTLWRIPRDVFASLPERLRAAQSIFHETGGLHAAGLFAPDGSLETMAEDVGRHNAVDKVIGRMVLMDALPLTGFVLFVSGRTSFEIVQKAWTAGIPVVASVSAPTSLAIELACEAGITLAGFVRGDTFNLYAHPQRVA